MFLSGCKQNEIMNINTTIDYVFPFELERYLGVWYEIARFDHSFERGLQGTTATYTLRKDGKIEVLNQGFKESLNGERKVAVGKAKIPDPNDPRRLKVSFFWFFYADYFILELSEDYQYALIGSKSDQYLWILSRKPQLDDHTRTFLLQRITLRGYNPEKLIWVDQPDLNK